MRKCEFARRARLFAAGIILLAVAALWLTGAMRGVWRFEHLEQSGLDFGKAPNKTFTARDGEGYGTLNSGPNYSLPAGTYTLVWAIETDAENRIRVTTSNGARVEPAQIVIEPNQWTMRETFTLLDDAENVEFLIDFAAGTRLAIHDIELRMPCTDRLWMVTFAALSVAALLLLDAGGWLTRERKQALLLLAAAVLFASVPAFRENINAGHDVEFHRSRLRNVVSALSEGQFPVRVGGYMYNGYGGASSLFYPDLCLYIPALLMMSGASIQFAMRALIIGLNALSALGMYLCGRRVFGSRRAGVCAAALYTLSAYRLMDIYTRMALGEAAAMAVMPLFMLGLWEVVFGNAGRWRWLVLGASAVFCAHMLSTVMCAAVAVVVCALALPKMIREKRLLPLVKAAAGTAAVCLFLLVPMLEAMLSGQFSMGSLLSGCASAAIEPWQLFADDLAFSREIGLSLLVAAAASAYVLMGKKDAGAKTAKALLLACAALALMTTTLFPWAALESRFGVVNYLQFPWRLLTLVSVLGSLACGCGLARLDGAQGERMPALALALCVLCAYPLIQYEATAQRDAHRLWQSNSHMTVAYTEYLLHDTDLRRTKEHGVLVEGDARVTQYEKRGTRISAQIEAREDARVVLPLFGFDGYRVEVNGQPVQWERGDNNRLTVPLAAGTQGELRVHFVGRLLWRAAEVVSLIAALALAAGGVKSRRRASLR